MPSSVFTGRDGETAAEALPLTSRPRKRRGRPPTRDSPEVRAHGSARGGLQQRPPPHFSPTAATREGSHPALPRTSRSRKRTARPPSRPSPSLGARGSEGGGLRRRPPLSTSPTGLKGEAAPEALPLTSRPRK